ncbi:MAG: hypothetical protein GXP45_00365 [bacterium]|nr:hypothetical protein [bacterium]
MKTANSNLDVNTFAGVVPNALLETHRIFSKLFDSGNHVTIPYFYYDVISLDSKLKNGLLDKESSLDFDALRKYYDLKSWVKEKEYSYLAQLGLRPNVQITGIKIQNDNLQHTIPHQVISYVDTRLVANQDPYKIASSFE